MAKVASLMRWIAAVVLVAACGPAEVQERSESSTVAACDWCPGSPQVTTSRDAITTCACPAPGGIGSSVQFFSDDRAPTCAHVQCMFVYYCAPPNGRAPDCPP